MKFLVFLLGVKVNGCIGEINWIVIVLFFIVFKDLIR